MTPVDLIIYPRWLITMDDMVEPLAHHGVVVDKGQIMAIDTQEAIRAKYQARETRELADHALLPGFINSHTHIAMNLLRGLADDLPLMTWLQEHIWPAEQANMGEAFVYDGSLLAIAEMIKSGVTCFNDMYFFPEQTIQAVKEAGIRASIGINIMSLETAWAKDLEECFSRGLAVYEKYKQEELIRFTLAPHAVYTVNKKGLVRVAQTAEDLNLPIHMHVQETAFEVEQCIKETKQRPVRYLYDLGLVTDRLLAVHMTQIVEDDLELIKAGGASIVHCPESNAKLASGYSPIPTVLAAGINVALGTDGAASNNDLDMLGEMRSAALNAKLLTSNPEALPAEQALSLATINGARALHQEKQIGSLVVGKAADMIAINLNQLSTVPVYHPISQIVYAANRGQVSDVWVNGKALLTDHQLTTLDEAALLEKAAQWQKKLS